MFEGEWFGLAASHGVVEDVERFGLGALGFGGCVLLALALAAGALCDDVDARLTAGAGEGGIGPFTGEFGGSSDDGGRGNGRALGAVAGERVGVAEVAGSEVAPVERDAVPAIGTT